MIPDRVGDGPWYDTGSRGWRPAGDEFLSLAELMGTAVGRGVGRGRARARRWGRAAANAGTRSSRADLEEMLSGLGFATCERGRAEALELPLSARLA